MTPGTGYVIIMTLLLLFGVVALFIVMRSGRKEDKKA